MSAMWQDVPSQEDTEQAFAARVRNRAGVSVSSVSVQGSETLRPHFTYEDPQENSHNSVLGFSLIL